MARSTVVRCARLRSPGEHPIQIEISESPDHTVAVDQSKVIRMTETSATVWQRFNGQITSGISYSKGNQATQYNLGASLEYPSERWVAGGSYNSSLAASTGSTVSTRNALDLYAARLLRWDNWFYAGVADFLQSSEQGIDFRTNLGGGVGRYLKNTNRANIWVLGGLAWQNTRYSQSLGEQGTQNVAAALIAAQAKFFVFNKTNLTINGYILPALSQPGRVYTNTTVTYYVKLFGGLNWNVSFYGNWDNQPPRTFLRERLRNQLRAWDGPSVIGESGAREDVSPGHKRLGDHCCNRFCKASQQVRAFRERHNVRARYAWRHRA